MDTPQYQCCAYPQWDKIEDGESRWVCDTCGCVYDALFGGVMEEGEGGFQIEDIPGESEDHLYED